MDLQCGQIHIILQWFDMKLWTHGFVNGIGILTQIGEWNESNRYDNEKKIQTIRKMPMTLSAFGILQQIIVYMSHKWLATNEGKMTSSETKETK